LVRHKQLGLIKGSLLGFFKAILSEKSGLFSRTWFNGARNINKLIKIGERLAVSGKVEFYNKLQIVHPQYDKLNTKEDPLNSGIIMSLYPISGILRKNRIDSLFFRKIIRKIYGELREIPDFFKEEFRKKYNIISLDKGLREIHFPHSNTSLDKGIKRLKFNEHFFFQLQMLSRRKLAKNLPTVPLKKTGIQKKMIYNNINFELTNAQKRVLKELKDDLSKPYAMDCLLQGDVGSGKTILAILAASIAVLNNSQVAIMATTKILSNQYYKFLKKLADLGKMSCAQLIGGMPNKDRKKNHIQV
jgi:RecG-like helicase